MLDEATGALARLDAEALGELERRALKLQALLLSGARCVSVPELAARHRVFASVVRATSENLCVLDGGSARGYGAARAGNPWDR